MKLLFAIATLALGDDICYDNLGCFTDDPPFSIPGYRPPHLPQSPSRIHPVFWLSNERVYVCFN
jgi:hypothetical protein